MACMALKSLMVSCYRVNTKVSWVFTFIYERVSLVRVPVVALWSGLCVYVHAGVSVCMILCVSMCANLQCCQKPLDFFHILLHYSLKCCVTGLRTIPHNVKVE